jgi:hypothetical protein
MGFWIDEATKSLTLADGTPFIIRRFDDRWISAASGDVPYELSDEPRRGFNGGGQRRRVTSASPPGNPLMRPRRMCDPTLSRSGRRGGRVAWGKELRTRPTAPHKDTTTRRPVHSRVVSGSGIVRPDFHHTIHMVGDGKTRMGSGEIKGVSQVRGLDYGKNGKK